MELNHRERTARLTIVYYGPAAGGKTTNLQVLHGLARPAHKGDLVSVNSSQGRTILFDLMPLNGLGLAGWELKLRLIAVPGQSMYAAARRLSVRGADAIVFVANSANDRWYENPESLRELTDNLRANDIDPQAIPTLFQYNKRDLPDIMPLPAMEQGLNPRGWPSVPAVASRGEGVRDTLSSAVRLLVEDVGRRFRSLALPAEVSPEDWTREGLLRVFGPEGQADAVPAAAPAASDASRRVVRVDVRRTPEASGVPGDRLAESYAQASMALGQAVEDLRQQRDAALRVAEDLRHALATVESAAASGRSGDEEIGGLLGRMAQAGRSRRASLLAPGGEGRIRILATLTRDPEPFAGAADGARLVGRHLLKLSLRAASDPLTPGELRSVLASASPPVHAVASVPLHCGRSVHGLFLLYYGATDSLLTGDELAHLGWMGRGLSASLLASRTRSKGADDARRRELAVEAAARALQRRDGDGSGGRVATAVRSLARGTVSARPEPLDLILEAHRRAGITVVSEPELVLHADAGLLVLALDALLELVAGQGKGPARVFASREKAWVLITVRGSQLLERPQGGDTRWLLAQAVAQLHAGELLLSSSAAGPAFTLRLPAEG